MERYLYILYERLSIIKLTIFHREIYQFNVIPIEIKIVLLDNLILTFILNIKNQKRARNILQKKNKLEGISANVSITLDSLCLPGFCLIQLWGICISPRICSNLTMPQLIHLLHPFCLLPQSFPVHNKS